MSLRGSPYAYGGVSPDGFDCSGFTYFVFNRAGIPVSCDMTAQYESGVHPSRDHLVPGDLAFFQNTYMAGLSHAGIFVGNGELIHANTEDSGVTVSRSARHTGRLAGTGLPDPTHPDGRRRREALNESLSNTLGADPPKGVAGCHEGRG